MGRERLSHPSESSIHPAHRLAMTTLRKRPASSTAAATFLTMLAAIAAPPSAPAPVLAERAPTVQAQTLQAERSSAPVQAPSSAQSIGAMDDPRKNRVLAQRRNAIRQVRRRMERQGYILTGRQWRNLMRSARRFLATGVVS